MPKRKEVALLKAKDAVDRFVTVQVLVHKVLLFLKKSNLYFLHLHLHNYFQPTSST